MRRIYLSPVLFIELMSVALAQPTAGLKPLEPSSTSHEATQPVRVSIGFNVSLRAPKKDQALKAQEQLRRTIYNLASHECTLLRDIVGSDCKLELINVSADRTPGADEKEPESINFFASANFLIVPKQ
jgi:hypothetical protein